MKKAAVCVLALAWLILVPRTGRAQSARMLNTRDSPLEWIYIDRILQGEGIPTTVQSLSVREAAFYGIDTGRRVSTEPRISGKASIRPFAIGWRGLDLSRRMTDSSLLERFRLDDPVMLLGLSFSSASFYGTTEIDFGTDSLARYAEEDGLTGIWEPMDFLSYWVFPEESYLAWSDRHVTVAAGRFATGIGLGDANILLNGKARWYDQIQFAWWSDRFRFFSFWGTSSSHLNEAEYYVQSYSVQRGSSWGWDTINNHDASTQALSPFKMFTYHRLEFKPSSSLGFGISEMQLVGGKVPDLTNLLPSVIWHNTYTAGVSNVMLHADTWLCPLKGVLVYGEFLMDDGKAPEESKTAKPNSWGWELGATAALPLGLRDWRFALTAEYSHIDRWTYNRWQPYLVMYQRQLITGGNRGFDTPLGHPEGGDVDRIGLRFLALTREGKSFEAGYSFILKGPVYLGMIENNQASTDPAYIPVYYDYDEIVGRDRALDELLGNVRKRTHAFFLEASWPLSSRCEVEGGIDFRYIRNAGHVEGKTATEVIWNAGLKLALGQ